VAQVYSFLYSIIILFCIYTSNLLVKRLASLSKFTLKFPFPAFDQARSAAHFGPKTDAKEAQSVYICIGKARIASMV